VCTGAGGGWNGGASSLPWDCRVGGNPKMLYDFGDLDPNEEQFSSRLAFSRISFSIKLDLIRYSAVYYLKLLWTVPTVDLTSRFVHDWHDKFQLCANLNAILTAAIVQKTSVVKLVPHF
jgi:hypothetical protein